LNPLHSFSFTADNFVGKIIYNHNLKSSSVNAFEMKEEGGVELFIPRKIGAITVTQEIFDESGSRLIQATQGVWCDKQGSFDIYSFGLNLKQLGVGLYFYRFIIDSAYGTLFAYENDFNVYFSKEKCIKDLFQLSVCDFKYKEPMHRGVIYHIFVDRFNRGGDLPIKEGTLLIKDWDKIPEYPSYPGAPLKNNTFYGGSLYGIIEKLDYLSNLGVSTLYLSPIFDAASNHKYDTGDYMSVDSMFGGDAALELLINKAKEYNIGIILDGVFNHTGSDSIYFNKEGNYNSIGAYQSKGSPYYSWYDFQGYPDEYTCWWGVKILPRINPDIKACREYFVGNGGVIEKYAKMGIQGFRLDVVDELSDEFVSLIKKKLNESNKASTLYGEVWEDASNKIAYDKRKRYYLGDELDGVMNYPVRTGIIEYIKNKNISPLRYALTTIINNAPVRITNTQMNLLGTHDTERILTVLGGESSQGKSNAELSVAKMADTEKIISIKKLKIAYTILATIPGVPAIFYGDEAGLEGYHDPFNRMPYPWGKEDKELLSHYQLIGRIRKANKIYENGEFRLLYLDEDFLIFERFNEKHSYVTLVNNSNNEISLGFKEEVSNLFDKKKSTEFLIAPYSSLVIKTTKNNEINLY